MTSEPYSASFAFINFAGTLVKGVGNAVGSGFGKLLGSEFKVVGLCQPAEEAVAKSLDVPVVVNLGVVKIKRTPTVNGVLYHFLNRFLKVFAVKNLIALGNKSCFAADS